MQGKSVAAAAVAALVVGPSMGGVVVSEILGYSFGDDAEFIEIVNSGSEPVDISGWSVELWDADVHSPGFGKADGLSPYAVVGQRVLKPGETYTWGNINARNIFGDHRFDAWLPRNAVENESYVALVVDARGEVVDSVLVLDENADRNGANRASEPLTPRATIAPVGGTCVPGIYWMDGEFRALDGFLLNTGLPQHGSPSVYQAAPPCAADVDADGVVTVLDLMSFLGGYRAYEATVGDLLEFLGAFRDGCGS